MTLQTTANVIAPAPVAKPASAATKRSGHEDRCRSAHSERDRSKRGDRRSGLAESDQAMDQDRLSTCRAMLCDQLGRDIHLTTKEVELLDYLYRANGRAIAIATLLQEVWGYSPRAESHTVETHVYRLRKKIEPDPKRTRFLITDPDGYRLDAKPKGMAARAMCGA